MAFDLGQPWATHRRYQVFTEKHSQLFTRPEVTADRIVMCQTIMEVIQEGLQHITNSLFSKYALTSYLILYIIRSILNHDKMATKIMEDPAAFVRDPNTRDRFRSCIRTILGDVTIDLNAEVDALGPNFDYRGKLRDEEWVQKLTEEIAANHLKLVARGRIPSFTDEWHKPNA